MYDSIIADLKAGPCSTAELKKKYGMSRNALCRAMDTIGQTEPVYNPIPGVWAILGKDEDYEKGMY